MMRSRKLLVTALTVILGGQLLAADVGVPGSSTKYPDAIEATVGGQTVKMMLTGTAMRTKFLFNVYAIGSYIHQGTSLKTAEQLAVADCPNRLHLVMERSVDGKEMAEVLRVAIRANYAEPAFNEEVSTMVAMMRDTPIHKGDHILLTHIPGVGLQCSVAGKTEFVIKNVHFAQAVWEIYLGKNNLGEGIKKGLVSRL